MKKKIQKLLANLAKLHAEAQRTDHKSQYNLAKATLQLEAARDKYEAS